jgi:hypothetical protein
VSNLKLQCRLRQASTGDYLWHLVSLSPQNDVATGETSWIGFMADIHAQKEFEQTLQDNQELKEAQRLLRNNEKDSNQTYRNCTGAMWSCSSLPTSRPMTCRSQYERSYFTAII